jgi:O-antigen/teichoic acid export membrane protein
MPLRLPARLTRARLRQLWYVPLLGAAMGLMLARLLIMARLFDVPAFATYASGLLVSSSFSMLACLGLQSQLQRSLPVMIVRRREHAGAVLLTQCTYVACGCAALGAVAAGAGLSLAGLSPSLLAIGLLHGLAQQLFLVATVESRSRGDPLRFARQNLERALVVLAVGVILAATLRHAGAVLAGEAVVSLLMALVLMRRQLLAVPLALGAACRLAWRRLPALQWKSAFALLAVASLGFLTINGDRWLAAEWLDPRWFAQYAFAWTVLLVAQSVQVLINASLYPLLARRFASGGREAAFRVGAAASLGLLLAGIVVALPLWAVLDIAIERGFPAYADSRLLLPAFLAIAVLRVSDFWSSYLVIVGLEVRVLVLNVSAALAAGAVWWVWRGPGTVAVGLADIAALAVLLAVAGYAVAATAAWHAAHD